MAKTGIIIIWNYKMIFRCQMEKLSYSFKMTFLSFKAYTFMCRTLVEPEY